MHSERSEVRAKGGRARSLAGLSRRSARKSALRRLSLEDLESRMLLASFPQSLLDLTETSTLPAPVVPVNSQIDITDTGIDVSDESAPSIAVDRNNPQKLAAVWTRNDPRITGPTHIFVEGATSSDGGQTWNPIGNLGFAAILPDPSTSNPITTFAQVTDASVAFDRNDNFYVLTSQHQAGAGTNSPNALVLNKFNFSGGTPLQVVSNKVVYESTQDQALTPTLAVDDNVASFTDVDANGQPYTQTDPFAGNVYIAWATNDLPPSNPTPGNFNPNRILMVASSNGGFDFSGPVVINDSGNFGNQRATTPKLAISQGRPRNTAVYGPNDQGVPGGQVSIIYDDFGTLANAGPPQSIIWGDRTPGAVSAVFNGTGGPIIDASAGTPSTITPTDFPINVNITNPNFISLSDLSVSLTLQHPAVNDLTVVLIPPQSSGLQPITLVLAGGQTAGANFGIAQDGVSAVTTFTDAATRLINNQASTSPYMGYYRPQGGSFAGFYRGATAAQLSGTWTLEITDTKNGSVGSLRNWSLNLTSGMTPGQDTLVATTSVRGSMTAPFPLGATVTGQGIGPGISLASDNTLGAYSPFQGRLYAAFVDRYRLTANPADNTDIFLKVSDDGGLTWRAPGAPGQFGTPSPFSSSGAQQVNDDLAVRDGFSEGNRSDLGRPQFQPQVVVDQATGSVVLSWFDARNDAARARVATYIAASSDGGQTYAPQVFANRSQLALDAITGQTVNLGPVPDNQSGGNPNTDGVFGFGTHQGLAVYGGEIHPIWSSNENGINNGTLTNIREHLDIRTVTATIAAGPRVIDSTMGAIGLPGDTVNPQLPNAPTPSVRAFQVTFDRPIDAGSFTPAAVQVYFRDITPNNVSGGPVPVISVVPIPTPTDPNNPNNIFGFTQFQVNFAPRTAVGTYSYIINPTIHDRIRGTTVTVTSSGTPQNFASSDVPKPVPDLTTITSTLTVSGFAANQVIANLTANLTINHTFDSDLLISLIAPDGTQVVLANHRGPGGQGFINTTFDDAAPIPIRFGQPPYTGSFRPDQPLAQLAGHAINGTWTLVVADTVGFDSGTLQNWSLNITPGTVTSSTNTGNPMDQDADGNVGEPAQNSTSLNPPNGTLGDAYAAPSPTNTTGLVWPGGTFVPGPYDPNTLPLVIPGPHLVDSHVPGAAVTPDNLVLNGTVGAIDVTFDRDMDPASITPSSILRIIGPAGEIIGPADFNNTVFSDAASTSIQSPSAVPPFAGAFRPQQPLSAFNGKAAGGAWRLVIKDDAPAGANRNGSLTGWSLGFSSTPTVFNSTGAPLAITPTRTITSTINVPSGLVAQGVTVTLNIDHPFDPDLEATLIGPDGTTVKLFTNVGSNGVFTITPNPLGSDPNPAAPRTYRIGFPQQRLSGTYTVTLASTIRSAAGDALDTNLNAGVDLLRGTPTASSTTISFPSSNVPVAITPQKTVISTLNVPQAFLVQGMTLTLNINYPNDPDLEATLIGPDGTTIRLFTGVGSTGTQANFSNTTFDDTATTLIQNGGPPFFGRFVPQQPLSAFNGKSAGGVWTLQIKSNAPANSNRFGSLTSWSLAFQKSQPITGLGESVADQASVSFRIFTTDPTNPLSHTTWTPIGPAPISNDPPGNGYSGQVGAIAIDPSDPSGNTVFVAGASGGIWKTTNFLTTDPHGPTYVPLTDFGPSSGLNVGSIAVFTRNNDPNQSIIIAGTGFADSTNFSTFGNTSRGVGFLRSMDGGATWTLLDSTNNNLPFTAPSGSPPQFQRDHLFAQVSTTGQATSTYKVVVDPRPLPNGNVIVYAALAGLNGGLWRSDDTGQTWRKLSVDTIQGTLATDVVLDLNSATIDAVSNPTGNVNVIYAAFQGQGVYISPNRGQNLNLMAGNNFDPLIRDPDFAPSPALLVENGTFPGNPGRIVLAKPALVPSTEPGFDVKNALYEGWLYAAVSTADGGALQGLYLTKDNGATWTQVHFGNVPLAGTNPFGLARPSNDPNRPNYRMTSTPAFPNTSNYNIAVAVDPTNPNIVYLGGTSVGEDSALIRIDASRIYDSHAAIPFDSSRPDGGQLHYNTAGRMQLKSLNRGLPFVDTLDSFIGTAEYTNLIQSPLSPFQTNTTLFINNVNSVGANNNGGSGIGFLNDGSGTTWTPFDQMLNVSEADVHRSGSLPSTNVHRLITFVDPLTGRARLIVGDDQGIFTGVDNNGQVDRGIGTQDAATYSRNGNLQISQFYYGAAQPSALAAQVAQAFAYGNGLHSGIASSDPNVLGNGNTSWEAPSQDFGLGNTLAGEIAGVGVQTDQQGRGIVYQYLYPGLGGAFTDFFQVSAQGGPFISRTTGLIQNNGVSDPQWPTGSVAYANGLVQGNFTVNPLAGDQVIMSSNAGRIFSTTNQGQFWLVIADPASLDGTYAPALTYGAPDPSSAAGIGNLNNFIYAGTVAGHIFVTTSGGGTLGGGNAWTDISSGLDGSPVMKIITNPTRGSHEAYAITQAGVYHTANSLAPAVIGPGGVQSPVWTNITGNLLALTTPAFGSSSLSDTQPKYLTSIVADWRYVIPDNPTVQNGPTHPVLYASADSGVYRSLDNGQTWAVFPNIAFDDAPRDGGMLPNAHVTDLNLALGNIDPTTGRAVAQPGDPNALLATTFGRGTFSIRLAPIVFPNTAAQPNNIRLDPSVSAGVNASGVPLVSPNTARPIINGFSEQTAFGNTAFITIYDLTNPNNPRIIGGFDPNNPSTRIPANQTDAFGRFSVQINQASFTSNGTKTVGIQATDGSGTTGNVATFTFVLQARDLGLPQPPTQPTIGLSPFDDSSNGQRITNVRQPHILGTTSPNVTVELFFSSGGNPTGSVLATGTSDAGGNFILSFPNPLPDGPVTVQVRATNSFGSTISQPLSFTIDTQGPTVAPSLGILPADDTGIQGDGITSNRRPRFSGTTDPGAIVEVFNSGNLNVPLATTTADNTGAYTVQLPNDLNNGTITVQARARDVAGNQGPLGATFTLTVTTVAGDYNADGRADLALYRRSSPQALWLIQGVTSAAGTPFGVGTLDIPLQGDFNGDGRDDLAVYRPSTAQWFVPGIFPGSGVQYGQALVDIPVPGDYFGIGQTTIATFRPTTGEWFIANSALPTPILGQPGDIPVPGDYDGTGRDIVAVYRPSTGQFLIAGRSQPIQLGTPGEVPVPGTYDNTATNRRTEPAVFNPSTGVLTVLGPNGQPWSVQFDPGSVPVPGDYDGVGRDEPAAYNPTTGVWSIYAPGTNVARTVQFTTQGAAVPVDAPYSYRKLPVAGDYNADGRADLALFRRGSSQAQWFINGVAGPIAFGSGTKDIPLQGDFNGDGRADLAIYRPSSALWFVPGAPPSGFQFGWANVDLPVPADYYGTGQTVIATFRPTNGQWFIGGTGTPFTLGRQGDTPVPGNYDGTGKAQIAVFRPAANGTPTQWLILGANNVVQTVTFGGAKDVPVPADYDGVGHTQIAVYRPGTGQWFIAGHAQPVTFGGPNDIPAPGDYDGTGKTQIAVYRPSTGQLFIAGHAQPITFGGPNDVPANAPFLYRSLSHRISATAVSKTSLNFGSQAATLSAASVSAPAQTSTPKTQASKSAAPVVANYGRPRPNQQVTPPATQLRAIQAHDDALASLPGRPRRRRP